MMDHITANEDMKKDMQECIENCLTCHATCLATIPHCLGMGGEHASPNHISLLLECVQICQTSADFMVMNSNLHGRICAVCAEACERCAQDCERLANDDEQMLACADMCQRCAESCRYMAALTTTP